jgi:dihydroorotate dehydrogenase
MEFFFRLRAYLFSIVYRGFLKPLFFLLDPEKVHDSMLAVGFWLGNSTIGRKLTRLVFLYQNPKLSQTIKGIFFSNPIGLAAGFDKDGRLTQILPEVGFGFAEIGSVTGHPCVGNPGRRLWRLKKSKSIVVNYGLKNVGAEVISTALSELTFKIPIGISIAKTNIAATTDEVFGIADYVQAYTYFAEKKVGDYVTINISCPNTCGGQPFLKPDALSRLLAALATVRLKYQDQRPWFIKLAADIYPAMLDGIIDVSRTYQITGFICSNVTKNRHNKKIKDHDVPDSGGLSGAVVKDLSTNLISYIYKKTGREFIIIGCGGIFSADDAYEKIKAGASLLQLITGMIFQGPQLIAQINQGLVDLLRRDGYTSIEQAVGADFK